MTSCIRNRWTLIIVTLFKDAVFQGYSTHILHVKLRALKRAVKMNTGWKSETEKHAHEYKTVISQRKNQVDYHSSRRGWLLQLWKQLGIQIHKHLGLRPICPSVSRTSHVILSKFCHLSGCFMKGKEWILGSLPRAKIWWDDALKTLCKLEGIIGTWFIYLKNNYRNRFSLRKEQRKWAYLIIAEGIYIRQQEKHPGRDTDYKGGNWVAFWGINHHCWRELKQCCLEVEAEGVCHFLVLLGIEIRRKVNKSLWPL